MTGEVLLIYCDNHTGHDNEICHLCIPEDVKMSVYLKLYSGVSIDMILYNIHKYS